MRFYFYLITALCSSKTSKIQVELFGSELKPNQSKVLGFIGASMLNFDVEIWAFELTHEDMKKVFSEWEKINHFDYFMANHLSRNVD